ncbi:hypothetical protein [Rhabdaerophilum calidifontis]|uniref:hypothetical protein n=1 Tax=Rhabdaerophilum calidifontis TaxID=2604328 RepID=UPI00123B6773|nr:hypothetical protein [Rhabdaerophilum calidifontis]
MRRVAALAAALAGLGAAGAASAFDDATTGFGLAPPPGYSATRTGHRRQFDIGVGLNPIAGRPTKAGTGDYLCEAGFKQAEANAKLSRAEINALIERPEWVNLAKAAFEFVFRITDEGRFTLRGYRGLELLAAPKAGPDHENVRVFVSLAETPKGRVTLICATTRAEFAAALADFRAIRAGIRLPE